MAAHLLINTISIDGSRYEVRTASTVTHNVPERSVTGIGLQIRLLHNIGDDRASRCISVFDTRPDQKLDRIGVL
jgi:hypothetical protein